MKQRISIPKALEHYLNKFCHVCGTKVILKKKKFYNYDDETGKPEYLYTVACPKRSFFADLVSSFKVGLIHENHKYLVCIPKPLWGTKGKNGKEIMHTTILEQSRW